MFLVSDGTLNTETTAIVVERREDLAAAVGVMRQLVYRRGGDPDAVTVNPVGPPLSGWTDEVPAPRTYEQGWRDGQAAFARMF